MHRVLRQALQQAFNWGLIARNPVDQVKPPKVEKKTLRVLDPDGTAKLLSHFRSTRMFVPVLLATLCGLRRGEIAALKWKHVDFRNATLSIYESIEQTKEGTRRKEAKSGRARNIALPALVVPELRRHRARQAEALLSVGVRIEDEFPVVAREDGEALQPNSLTHEFVRILGWPPTSEDPFPRPTPRPRHSPFSQASIRKSRKSDLAIRRSELRSIFIRA
jgi:integrase